jgi:acyl-CoA thioesterase FadM
MTVTLGPPQLEAVYRVRFDEATPEGSVRPGALLGFLQDVAWRHSSAMGFTREWYEARDLTWLVRAIELELGERIAHADEVHVTTRITGYRRVMARRVSDLTGSDGRVLGRAVVDWAMTNGETAVRVPPEFTAFPGAAGGPFTPIRIPKDPPPAGAFTIDLSARRRELDPMGHANNGSYVDWLDEAVFLAGGHQLVVTDARCYVVEYLRPAALGQELRSSAWPDAGGFAWQLADAGTGDSLARGRLDPV